MLAIVVLVALLMTSSAQAYFYQPQQYQSYRYQTYNPYNYGYQDTVSQLVQQNLNFVSNFVYVPAPIHPYFYNYYSPYSYYGGYGYGYNYGW